MRPNGNVPVKISAWGYKDFAARYRLGDKVIISGSRVTIKAEENGKMRSCPKHHLKYGKIKPTILRIMDLGA